MTIEEIYVYLLDEGTDMWRPAHALRLDDGLYCLLWTPRYDPEDEKWEIVPGTVVRCELRTLRGRGNEPSECMVAVAAAPLAELASSPSTQ